MDQLEASLIGPTPPRPDLGSFSATRATTPKADTIAIDLACAEYGRSPRRGEVWSVYYADIGEAVTYCPECAAREFDEPT